MDFSQPPLRADHTALTTAVAQRQAPDAVSTAPETARPVVAADKTGAASDTAQERFQPLDIYEVGDNDQMPVPPEPPRQSTVLAVMANAQPVAEADTPTTEPIADTLRQIYDGPSNPTVDIRR